MLFLTAIDSSSEGLEDVVKLPEKGSQMRSTDQYICLHQLPEGFFLLVDHCFVGLKGGGLQIDSDVCEMIGGVTDSKPNFTQSPDKVRLWNVGHLQSGDSRFICHLSPPIRPFCGLPNR